MSTMSGIPVKGFRTRADRSDTTIVDLMIVMIAKGSRFGSTGPVVHQGVAALLRG